MGLTLKTPGFKYNYQGKQLSSPGGQSANVSQRNEKCENGKSSECLHDRVFIADRRRIWKRGTWRSRPLTRTQWLKKIILQDETLSRTRLPSCYQNKRVNLCIPEYFRTNREKKQIICRQGQMWTLINMWCAEVSVRYGRENTMFRLSGGRFLADFL